jgi:hypothetical protein
VVASDSQKFILPFRDDTAVICQPTPTVYVEYYQVGNDLDSSSELSEEAERGNLPYSSCDPSLDPQFTAQEELGRDGQVAGRMICFINQYGAPQMDWTVNGLGIFSCAWETWQALAAAPTLYDVFREAGPY